MDSVLPYLVGSAVPLVALIWKIWIDRLDQAKIVIQVRTNQKLAGNPDEPEERTWLVLLVSNQGRRPCIITMAGAEPVDPKKGGGFVFPLSDAQGGVRLDENYPTHFFKCIEDDSLDMNKILCFFVSDASNKGYYLSYRRLGRIRLRMRFLKRKIKWWFTGDLNYR